MLKACRYYFLLTLLCLVLYIPGALMLSMPDRDSAYFAQASKQMVETHDYWQVNFQDKPRHLKPPGIYWLEAASVKVFSPHDLSSVWPYRVPQMIGAWLSVLATFFFAQSFFNKRTSVFAANLLAISLGLQFISQLIMTDAVLLFLMILMQGSLWRIYVLTKQKSAVPLIWPALMWIGFAAGILIKGLTPVVFFITLAGLFIFDRGLPWWRQLKLGLGLLFSLVLTCAWLIPLSLHTHSNFIMNMINQDLLPKIQGGQQSHGQAPGFFLLTLPLTFWPGSLFFALAGLFAWQHRNDPVLRFLSIWVMSVWLVYECIPTKLPEYLLPIYPAIAILIAAVITNTFDFTTRTARIFFWIYGLIWLVYSLGLAFGFAYVAYYFDHWYSLPGLILGVGVVILSLVILVCYYRRAFVQAFYLNVVLALSLPLFFSTVLPSVCQLWLSEDIATTIQALPMDERNLPLLSSDYQEPSLVFLMGTTQVRFVDLSTMQNALAQHQRVLLLISKNNVDANMNAQTRILGCFSGFDMGNGHWQSLYLMTNR